MPGSSSITFPLVMSTWHFGNVSLQNTLIRIRPETVLQKPKVTWWTITLCTAMSFTWVMEPPRWETEESECILVPGMPFVMLPPWTAEIEAGKKITMKINNNVCCDGNMYDCYIPLPITVITENRFKRSNKNQQLQLWTMSTLHLPTLHTWIPPPPHSSSQSCQIRWASVNSATWF